MQNQISWQKSNIKRLVVFQKWTHVKAFKYSEKTIRYIKAKKEHKSWNGLLSNRFVLEYCMLESKFSVTHIYDLNLFQIPKSKATSGTLKSLVSLLTDQYEDDMSKVRAIYVWLTSLNINKLSHPLKNPKVGYTMFYLMKIKERLGNYSQLFNRMCK